MVLRVCRRVLQDWHLAEDAFQATFLVLAHKAHTIWPDRPLNCWLHGVARRVALKACSRKQLSNSSVLLPDVSARVDPSEEPGTGELRQVLDEELDRLPEKYRAPLVLCYLEGKTHEEAALQLCCPLNTFKSRILRARTGSAPG